MLKEQGENNKEWVRIRGEPEEEAGEWGQWRRWVEGEWMGVWVYKFREGEGLYVVYNPGFVDYIFNYALRWTTVLLLIYTPSPPLPLPTPHVVFSSLQEMRVQGVVAKQVFKKAVWSHRWFVLVNLFSVEPTRYKSE